MSDDPTLSRFAPGPDGGWWWNNGGPGIHWHTKKRVWWIENPLTGAEFFVRYEPGDKQIRMTTAEAEEFLR